MDLQKKKKNEAKDRILSAYIDCIESGLLFPTRASMLDRGITRDQIRSSFTNILKLREAAKVARPDLFMGVKKQSEYYTDKYESKLSKKVKKYKKFVITTVVNGQRVDGNFLNSLNNYCKVNDALLLIIPCNDPAHNLDNALEWHFDSLIKDYDFVFNELHLNSNIHISSIRINAKQINPHTGLGRFVQGHGSAIFGSPKQNLDLIPISNIKYPHALMSTGAITVKNYKTTLGNSLRSAFIAEYDHIVGAIIVEIENDKIYHFRQIQSDENGGFADLGKFYNGNKISEVSPIFVMGDLHAGEHDLKALDAWMEICRVTKVKEIIAHDIFNGNSVSHWEANDIITRAMRAHVHELDLKTELETTGNVLDYIFKNSKIQKMTVVKSNHDEFLVRWLKAGRFATDPHNFQIGCALANIAVDGRDPFIHGLKYYSKMKNFNKIKFLERDEDYKVSGIELGSHGDKGPNGSKGTKANIENAYGKAVIGHSHTSGILRGIFQVGTTSKLKLMYNDGPSSWIHCSCLVYPNGQRQLINAIDGSWRARNK